jgi:hypothetical protein
MATGMTKEQPRPGFVERHYTLGELAMHWRMSPKTLRDWFIGEPGVVKFGNDKLRKGQQRCYISMRVPESVALRVYHRMTGKAVHQTPGGRPAA